MHLLPDQQVSFFHISHCRLLQLGWFAGCVLYYLMHLMCLRLFRFVPQKLFVFPRGSVLSTVGHGKTGHLEKKYKHAVPCRGKLWTAFIEFISLNRQGGLQPKGVCFPESFRIFVILQGAIYLCWHHHCYSPAMSPSNITWLSLVIGYYDNRVIIGYYWRFSVIM